LTYGLEGLDLRFGLRSAAVVLVALLALAIGVMPLTSAAVGAPVPPGPLGYWFKSGSGGFGVGSANAMAMPMAWYKGKLYAGVSNSSGAQVWRQNGTAWEKVRGEGFSSTGDMAVTSMCTFGDAPNDYLYVGSANMGGGCSVWRFDGTYWQDALTQGSSPLGLGFGSTNNHAATAMKVFKGELYVGLTNVIVGFPTGTDGAHVWRSPDGVNWTEVDDTAFDDAANYGITALEEYNGSLYTCTARFDLQVGLPDWTHVDIKLYDKGCQLLKSSSGSAGTWSVVATDGFGDPRNIAAFAMYSFGGKLYIGTANANAIITVETATMKITGSSFVSNGLDLYSYDGTGVPVAVVTGGFGSTSDAAVMCMNKVTASGKDYLMVGAASTSGPGKFKVFDGTSWRNGAYAGFGFSNNVGVASLAVDSTSSPPVVWAGTMNSNGGCEVWYTSEKLPPPGIDSITPSVGAQGRTVTTTDLAGINFDTSLSVVKLKRSGQTDINATGISVSSDGRHITCSFDLTGATLGLWDVYVENPDGQKSTKAGAFTVTLPTWYLAEGTSDWGFDTYVTIENPNPAAVTAKVTYMTGTGAKARPDITLPAMSQTVINPRNDIGAADFSTKVECKEGKNIAVDRRMIWTGPGAPSPEGHSSIGVTAAAPTWYLAEGSSNWGFETWLLIQNPNSKDATCIITYMIEGVGPKAVTKTVKANSRASFNMADDIGAADASIKVVSNQPVIAERAMYRNNRREGHDSIGTTAPAMDYYLAEGTTGWGFTTYVLVQNPNDRPADVNLTYMASDGPHVQAPFSMKANSRKTIRVNDTLPGMDFSTRVTGSRPVIAERAMYWGADTDLGEACHDSIGMSSPHTTFFLPDGETDSGYETWTLVQNPNSSSVKITVTYLTPTGTGNQSLTATIPGNSRQSFNMADKISSGRASIKVTCTTAGKKIMCERAMYWNNRGAGTDTIGGFSD
jgi:hypothetical protein